MSAPPASSTPAPTGSFDPWSLINQYLPGGAGDASSYTPDFIESLAVTMTLLNSIQGLKQLEIDGARLGLEQQQIENNKARLLFEAEAMLPFEYQKLEYQKVMQEYQLQEAGIGLDIARERSLQSQQSTLQARENTEQAVLATRRQELQNTNQMYQLELARSQATGRNFTGNVSGRRYMGGI